MKEVVIVSAARTPIGDFGGALKTVPPVDLMKTAMENCIKRAGLEKEEVESVFVGNCFSPLDQNVARISSLLLGLSYETPGLTINCACASSSQAIIAGANAIALGKRMSFWPEEWNP